MASNYVPRVNQLDAIDLNEDINRILQNQISKSLDILSLQSVHKFQEEINLLASVLTWIYSVGKTQTTFGQSTLMITYNTDQFTKFKQYLHLMFSVLTNYAKNKIKTNCVGSVNLQNALSQLENLFVVCKLVNFFRFLKYGTKPSLVDYILQCDYVSMDGNRRRNIGYNFMTRELIWGGFTEFLGFTIPLMNYPYIKRKFVNMFRTNKSNFIEDREQKAILTESSKCGYCNKIRPTLPHSMGCEHIFCYYCLAANKLADENFQCNICDFRGDRFKIVNVNI